MEKRNSAPFNAPTMVLVPSSLLSGVGAIPDDGYRRFVQCAKCTKTAKIFICYRGSEKSCNGSEATHTHINCECTEIKFAGSVELKTKKDRITYRSNESASNGSTVSVSKEEYERLKSNQREES